MAGKSEKEWGGGEFSESGEFSGSGAGRSGSSSPGRYFVDCAEAGQGCSLKLSGTYDEVMTAAVDHGRKAHGMTGDDSKLREEIKGYVKAEAIAAGAPGSSQGRSQAGASPGLPS